MFDHESGYDPSSVAPCVGSTPAVANCKPMAANAGRRSASDLQIAIQTLVGDDLAQVERLITDSTQSHYEEVNRLGRRAAAMGGKRLRPVLLLLSAQASRTKPGSNVGPVDVGSVNVGAVHADAARIRADMLYAAASVELVHAASLVHDDVMDGAVQRRHQPTVVTQAGNAAAVLLGDFLFTRAYALAASCRTTRPARSIASAATQLCVGELRQQASVGRWGLTLKQYRSILVQKTAALCEVSCRLGAWHGGAVREQVMALAKFGRSLGLAFQIYDDWLDYWGDARVGKTLGTDLRQLKPTLPLLRLLSSVSERRRAQLIEALEMNDFVRVQSALNASDSAEYTLAVAHRCANAALDQLSYLPESPAKKCLIGVAEYSVQRRE
ncbi:MAG: polyprenyl synthetase family protein [Pirellulaceae bacterium]